jgi:hypothetical protein
MTAWADIERYRATAARLRQLTRNMAFPESRTEALRIAAQFERLADYVEQRLHPLPRRSPKTIPTSRRAS